MWNRSYLVGNNKEKEKIRRLLKETAPIFIEYEYIDLCKGLSERLLVEEASNSDDFDYALCDYLDEIEEDITERIRKLEVEVLPYLLRVEETMHYFKKYLEQLNWLPLPDNFQVVEGSRGSVMMLYGES